MHEHGQQLTRSTSPILEGDNCQSSSFQNLQDKPLTVPVAANEHGQIAQLNELPTCKSYMQTISQGLNSLSVWQRNSDRGFRSWLVVCSSFGRYMAR